MAKIWQISDGRSYVVNGDPGTTITYTNSPSNGTAAGKPVTSIPAGATSVTFPSNGSEVEISSDTATIDQVFNAAAAGSGSSSSGSGSAGGVTFQIVTELPSQGAAGVIYLVKVSETGDDRFEEWIWVDSAWESIGTTAVDPTTYAKLIGGNTFEGNQVINGDLTVTGDVSGVTESNYNVVETAETTITPTGGTWVRYTGSETSLTVVEPGWDGEAEISYLETAVPVDLQGVTWSPAKPILTGNGPFVYALVHSREGEVLAGAYGYSTPTDEAIQAVAPIAWGSYTTAPTATGNNCIALGTGSSAQVAGFAAGSGAYAGAGSVAIGGGTPSATGHSCAIGYNASSAGWGALALGYASRATAESTVAVGINAGSSEIGSVSVGAGAKAKKATSVTVGSSFTEVVNGENVTNYCQTEGTGSITIGAGANTLNSTKTVDGVETTVESSNSVTIGCKASNSSADSVVIGAGANNNSVSSGLASCSIGAGAVTTSYSVAVGKGSQAQNHGVSVGYEAQGLDWSVCLGGKAKSNSFFSVSIGAEATVKSHRSVAIGGYATTDPESTIVIGADATITNTGSTPSTNTIAIGPGATASAPNAVVMGAGASNSGSDSVVIGPGSSSPFINSVVIGAGITNVKAAGTVAIGKGSSGGGYCAAVGQAANADGSSVAVGYMSTAKGASASLGREATASAAYSSAVGYRATVNDMGTVVFGVHNTNLETKTQLYFAGANTPLADTYEEGEAMMGYVVSQKTTDENGKIVYVPVAAGTQKLSVLFPNNSGFQPATLGLDDDMTPPKVFHPSDLDLPAEEPTEEPEDVTINIPEPTIPEPEPYTPLPVYPIVEPEDITTNIPEQEPYTPLPVYPIVEPEVPEIPEM